MTVYATRLVNGTDSRERMRRADAMALFPSGVGLARAGFRNDGGGVVTVNAGTMTVDVTPFTAWVDGGVSDVQGGYTFTSDATETLTVSPGHASLSRTDVVIAEVRDTVHDGSGSTDARLLILEGTPGSGVPALPTNALALREITVPAGLSAGTGGLASGNLSTDRRTYTTGLGGVLAVASEAERDALPAINGTEVYRTDLDRLQVRTAAGWRDVLSGDMGEWIAYTPTLVSGSVGTGGSAAITGQYAQIGKTIHYEIRMVMGTSGYSFSQNTVLGTPTTRTNPSIYGSNVMVKFFDNPAGNVYLGVGLQWSSGVSCYAMAANGLATGTLPFTLSAGDVVEVAGTYEAS